MFEEIQKSILCRTNQIITLLGLGQLDQPGQPDQRLRSATVNITCSKKISKPKGMVVKFMMSASICCEIPMNVQAAESRTLNMQTLRWAADAKSVLTREELRRLHHNLGNCTESVLWQAMYGNPQP